MLIIMGLENIIKYMINNNETKVRNTRLGYKINKYQKIFEEI